MPRVIKEMTKSHCSLQINKEVHDMLRDCIRMVGDLTGYTPLLKDVFRKSVEMYRQHLIDVSSEEHGSELDPAQRLKGDGS